MIATHLLLNPNNSSNKGFYDSIKDSIVVFTPPSIVNENENENRYVFEQFDTQSTAKESTFQKEWTDSCTGITNVNRMFRGIELPSKRWVLSTDTNNGKFVTDRKADLTVVNVSGDFTEYNDVFSACSRPHAVSFIELKPGSKLTEENLGQHFRLMAKHMMERRTVRQLVYGLLCTPTTGYVLKISKGEGGQFNYRQSAELSWGKNWDQLLFPIFGSDEGLGFANIKYGSHTADLLLGEGTSASVYSSSTDDDAVLKVFHKDGDEQLAFQHELNVYQKMENDNILGFPTLEYYDQTGYGLVLKPKGEVVTFFETTNQVVQLANLLIEVNTQTKLVHRDVRSSNIIQKEDTVYLFDWAFAVEEGKHVFAGSGSTASNAVLEQLAAGNNNVEYYLKDDLESLLKTYWIANKFGEEDKRKFVAAKQSRQPNEMLQFWNGIEADNRFKELMEHCRNVEQRENIGEWVEELERLLDGGSEEETTLSSSSSSTSSSTSSSNVIQQSDDTATDNEIAVLRVGGLGDQEEGRLLEMAMVATNKVEEEG